MPRRKQNPPGPSQFYVSLEFLYWSELLEMRIEPWNLVQRNFAGAIGLVRSLPAATVEAQPTAGPDTFRGQREM
jgi:hypothetical protein